MNPDQLDRAKLAVEEYRALHAELLQRNGLLIQVSTACIAAIVALVGFMATKGYLPLWPGISLIVFVVGILVTVWIIVDSDARNACKRIIEIEEYVNKCVGGDDKNPLSWERRFGLLSRNYADRFRSFNFDAR